MTSKKYTGKWFNPYLEYDKNKVHIGNLTINDNGTIYLEFIFEHDEPQDLIPEYFFNIHHINDQESIKKLCGYVKDQNSNQHLSFTLIHLEIIHFTRGGLTYLKLSAQYAISNFYFTKKYPLRFKSSMMKIDGIDAWLNHTGFKVETDYFKTYFETNITYSQPHSIDLIDTRQERLYFYFRSSLKEHKQLPKLSIDQSTFINYESTNSKRIDELTYLCYKIQNFFSFISLKPAHRIHHQLKIENGKPDPEQNELHTALDLSYLDYSRNIESTVKSEDFLFLYSNYPDKSKDLIPIWISIYDKYKVSFDQYFDLQYNPNIHPSSKLITICSVLEIFYVHYFNEDPRNLPLKLRNLIQTLPKVFNLLPISENDTIEQIVAVRKYFVHGKESKYFKQENLKLGRLQKLIIQLENIFVVCVLHELTFTEDQIIQMIKKHPWKWGVNK